MAAMAFIGRLEPVAMGQLGYEREGYRALIIDLPLWDHLDDDGKPVLSVSAVM
jgi:hypothetical protein